MKFIFFPGSIVWEVESTQEGQWKHWHQWRPSKAFESTWVWLSKTRRSFLRFLLKKHAAAWNERHTKACFTQLKFGSKFTFGLCGQTLLNIKFFGASPACLKCSQGRHRKSWKAKANVKTSESEGLHGAPFWQIWIFTHSQVNKNQCFLGSQAFQADDYSFHRHHGSKTPKYCGGEKCLVPESHGLSDVTCHPRMKDTLNHSPFLTVDGFSALPHHHQKVLERLCAWYRGSSFREKRARDLSCCRWNVSWSNWIIFITCARRFLWLPEAFPTIHDQKDRKKSLWRKKTASKSKNTQEVLDALVFFSFSILISSKGKMFEVSAVPFRMSTKDSSPDVCVMSSVVCWQFVLFGWWCECTLLCARLHHLFPCHRASPSSFFCVPNCVLLKNKKWDQASAKHCKIICKNKISLQAVPAGTRMFSGRKVGSHVRCTGWRTSESILFRIKTSRTKGLRR